MIILGADYHPGFQQIAFVDTNTGEVQERRLEHPEEAERSYRDHAACWTLMFMSVMENYSALIHKFIELLFVCNLPVIDGC
jgi:hypothetical protein